MHLLALCPCVPATARVWLAVFVLLGVATLALSARRAGPATVVYVSHAGSNTVSVHALNSETGALTLMQTATIPGFVSPGNSTPIAVSPDKRFLYVGTRGEPKVAAGFAIDAADGRLTHVASGPIPDGLAYIVTDPSGRFLLGASYPGHVITVSPMRSPGTVGPASQVLTGYPNAHSIQPVAGTSRVLALTLGNDRVNQFSFDQASGVLSPLPDATVALKAGTGPRHFVFHPNRRIVYVLGELDGTVHVLGFDATTGAMDERQTVSVVPAGFDGKPSAADIHITPDGRLLYTSDRSTNTLAGFRVAADGTLTAVSSVATEQTPRSFAIDPSGRFLFAVGQASNQMSVYLIDAATGALVQTGRYAVGKNPNWVEVVVLP